MRIIHISDIHIWRYTINPLLLMNKRWFGMAVLMSRRARRFRLERLRGVVDRVLSLDADHVLITGDLTTTALVEEFREAHLGLSDLLRDRERATVIPGNHDRYTPASVRGRLFETWFGAYAPSETYPWLRGLDEETAILGLDPTRAHISARGRLPAGQVERARDLIAGPARPRRLIVACHYPLAAPAPLDNELASKRLINAAEVSAWLASIGPHLYCCGHVHAAWAFAPGAVPNQLCLNAGAPLLRDHSGLRPPGFLEITLDDRDVLVVHHGWIDGEWDTRTLYRDTRFFSERTPPSADFVSPPMFTN